MALSARIITNIITTVVFIILIILLFWTNRDTSEEQENFEVNYDIMYNKYFRGQRFYHVLSRKESLESFLRNKERVHVFFLAPWNEQSREWKKSKKLADLSKHSHVVIVSDTHPDIEYISKIFNRESFPSAYVHHEDGEIEKIEFQNF